MKKNFIRTVAITSIVFLGFSVVGMFSWFSGILGSLGCLFVILLALILLD